MVATTLLFKHEPSKSHALGKLLEAQALNTNDLPKTMENLSIGES